MDGPQLLASRKAQLQKQVGTMITEDTVTVKDLRKIGQVMEEVTEPAMEPKSEQDSAVAEDQPNADECVWSDSDFENLSDTMMQMKLQNVMKLSTKTVLNAQKEKAKGER